MPEIDLSSVRLCAHCGEPLTSIMGGKKYHTECAHEAYRLQQIAYRTANPQKRTAINRKHEARERCTCCGVNPIATGNRFLCNLCYIYDGDDWLLIKREDRWDREKARVTANG